MAEVGYAANRRLLDAECISHDPADGAAALEAITSPVISTTCTRIPGMRFPDPRVQALLGACCALALRPAGFTSRDLRHYLGPQPGKTPEDMTSGQISYDLRRLRAHQIIERIPHSRAYQVTEDGLTIALFLTRLAQRLLIPGLAQLTSPGPPGRSRLREADRAYGDALTDLARQASLAALRHLQLSPAVITNQHSPVISRHTRRNLTRNSKSLRGKITYRAADRHPEQHRLPGITGIQDRPDIQGQCGKAQAFTRRRAIRQARAPPVKHHHPGTGREPAPEMLQGRFLPGQLDLADQRRDESNRDRPITDHRICDRHAVLSARVTHLGPQHSSILTTPLILSPAIAVSGHGRQHRAPIPQDEPLIPALARRHRANNRAFCARPPSPSHTSN